VRRSSSRPVATARYDRIGRTYASTRITDPRIARQIADALGSAERIVNVGAGTGSYEPDDRFVIAVEPSHTMLAQRQDGSACATRAAAEALPFCDGAFDAALATLTVHHWSDIDAGLREMQRVATRQVVFYFEPDWADRLWLVGEYFPDVKTLESERHAPGCERLSTVLDTRRIEPVPVPADCRDGFGGCFWNRPEAYLDPVVQDGISFFAQLDPKSRLRGTQRLRADLASGAWDERHGHLRAADAIDIGYRLLVAGHLS
jgi:SAM-dependent methyltransferase